MRAKPFQYQKEGVRQIEDYNGRALLSDEMGLGKTLQVLWALKRNPSWMPAIVVCPATLKFNWQHEAITHVGIRASVCEGQKPPSAPRITPQSNLIIINYDILRFWVSHLKSMEYKTVVFDEAHYVANPRRKRSKALRELCKGTQHVIAVTGTPLTNKPIELWHTLNILWPQYYKSRWSYAQEFCNPRLTRWGWDFSGASNLDRLHKQLTVRGMIRRRKVDVLQDLPPKVWHVVPCELSDYSEYKEASTNFLGWLKKTAGHRVRSASRAESLAKIGYLLRLVAQLKMHAMVEWCTRFLEESDEKLVVFGVHKSILHGLKSEIPFQSVIIDGSVTGRIREAAVQQFQHDRKTRMLIGNIRAAGVGITLTAARTTAFVELCWRPGDITQAADRVHRIGQDMPVWSNFLVASDTIEERLCSVIQRKQGILSSVLDGGKMEEDLNLYDELMRELAKGGAFGV